jgi:hypothetical protein
MDQDLDIPDILTTGIHARPYPHVYVQDELFQPRLRAQPVGDHIEFYLRYVNLSDLQKLEKYRFECPPGGLRTESKAKDPERTRQVAELRRKRKIRLLCIASKVDRMLTLTTRPFGRNLTRPEFERAFTLFNKEMIRIAPKWDYVACFEKQPESGQYHIHAAIRGRYDVALLRAKWHLALNKVWGRDQSLTQGEDAPGNVDVSYKPGPGRSKLSFAGNIAGYISKYVSKDVECIEFNRKGYYSRHLTKLMKPVSSWYPPSKHLAQTSIQVARDYGFLEEYISGRVQFHPLKGGGWFARVHLNIISEAPF